MKNNSEIHKKHNAKRKTIQVSLYDNDRVKMIQKYGHLLNASEAKKILLQGKISIQIERDNTDLKVLIVQLKKIGNNINQLALNSNANKKFILEGELRLELFKLDEVLLKINQWICESK